MIPTNQRNDCVVVMERQPYWGPELKRQFQDSPITVRECRRCIDLVESVAEFSGAIVLLVLDEAPAECLGWLANRYRILAQTACIVAASAGFGDLEWLVREAGGVFVDDEIGGRQMAKLCARHLNGSMPRRFTARGRE